MYLEDKKKIIKKLTKDGQKGYQAYYFWGYFS